MNLVRLCPDPWNEIVPGLWVGGHDYQPADSNLPVNAIVDNEFDLAVEGVRAGRRVLVRCQAGLNRSSLVAAFALLRLGCTGDRAIALIRQHRSPQALFNTNFQAYIAAETKAVIR